MMTLFFCDSADPIDKRERLREIGEHEPFADVRCICGERPILYVAYQYLGFRPIKRYRPSLACDAFLLSQILHEQIVPKRYSGAMNMAGIFEMCWHTTERLLDALMPPRARTLRLRDRKATIAIAPQSQTLLSTRIMTLAPYHAPLMEDAIRALKYDGNARASGLLAGALEDFLREELLATRAFSPRPIVLVPVPLHAKRRRERGFNQIEKVLEALPPDFRDGALCRIEPRALFRTRATPPQTKLHRTERLHNVRGAFAATERLIRGTHVFVIDDVCTTGATLAECAATLAKAGAQVTPLALARA